MIGHLRQVRSPGIRVQLTLWYTAVFAFLILLFSLILYTTLQAFLASGMDSALQLRSCDYRWRYFQR
jgi:two-component system OmpR family sensor kinase